MCVYTYIYVYLCVYMYIYMLYVYVSFSLVRSEGNIVVGVIRSVPPIRARRMRVQEAH